MNFFGNFFSNSKIIDFSKFKPSTRIVPFGTKFNSTSSILFTEFGIRDNVPNTDGFFFFGIRDIVLDI